MKHLLILGLMLIPSLAQAEPYKRPIDNTNPYQYVPLDNKAYSKARLQVAEACQNMQYALDHHDLSSYPAEGIEEIRGLMAQCNPDAMEWDAILQCQSVGVIAPECPVVELLTLDAGMITLSIP